MARYIDADKLTETIKYYYEHTGDQTTNAEHYAYGVALKEINRTPTVDVVEVKHGQWMPQIVNGVKAWDCSECKTLGSPHWKRCPICEAKMDGGKAE